MKTKWISVKEKLPEECEDFLVTDGFSCFVAQFNTGYKIWDFFGVNFWKTDEVTHWRALPSVKKLPEP